MSLKSKKIINVETVETVTVFTVIVDSVKYFAKLNLNSKLSNIRKELESINNIDDTLSFSKKVTEVNIDDTFSFKFIKVEHEDESNFVLGEIITINNNGNKTLYLIKSSCPNCEYLYSKFRLDYGRIISLDGIRVAHKRAFKIKDKKNCKLTKFGTEGYKKGQFEFNSKEDRIMKIMKSELSNINMQNFVKFGILMPKTKPESSSICNYIELSKVSLNFDKYLEPTDEFISVVCDAIKYKDLKKFRTIAEEYGQFISGEVKLGGKAYFVNDDVNKISEISDSGIENTCEYYKQKLSRLIGGKQSDSPEGFDEKAWISSLQDCRRLDCIEFKNPTSIFQLLPYDLRRQIIQSIGKRIHYSIIEDFNYSLEELGCPIIFELNLPSNIMEMIQNKEADCDIFATLTDMTGSKNDSFTCQIYYPSNGKPSLIINCIQKKFKRCDYKLKIWWMVVGYDINFDFILSNPTNTNVELIKYSYVSKNREFDTIKVQLTHQLIEKNIPFFGIPIISKLNLSNLVIGHNFRQSEDNEFIIDIFSYNPKKKTPC